MRIFWIVIGSVLACMAVGVVVIVAVLSTSRVEVEFAFAEPSSVYLYDNSTIRKKADEYSAHSLTVKLNNSLSYDKLSSIGSKSIDTKLRIDDSKKYSESVLYENRCVLFEYENEQTVVAWAGSDSKKITFDRLLIVLNDKNGLSDHYLYYSVDGLIFEDEPLVVAIDESALTKLFS